MSITFASDVEKEDKLVFLNALPKENIYFQCK